MLRKIGRPLKPLVPNFRFDLPVRLRDIAEKQVPMKLKPIVTDKTNAMTELNGRRY